ncbi:Predicted transcriptional regulator, contains HTH domain [Halogeometricum rufum]|uniref:Predicted transcriptional regulator, contains HTH domain n=1 Tax=Halogeometricum rufum TaxID=553469 RepID=A0A1I6HS22_9EURY|nr:MarR family transcriptional regulator [Halogeometricum rufum]SFR57249.1 Predicted transcriptional regulator, contains HTH domain [Halogeometricum rufum]
MTSSDTGAALDAIRVFANSANSVRIFEALSDGPTTSSDLAERTGASRSTVARVLDEGESRGWIDSAGSRYELTYVGEVMIEEFRAYQQTVEGIQQLGEVLNHLPEPAHELDIRHLRDARVTIPTENWPEAHLNRALELYRAGNTYRGLTQNAPDIFVRTLAELVEKGQLEFEAIIEAEFIDELVEDAERANPWHSFADSIWTYPGTIPLSMHIIDHSVVLWLGHIDENQWVGPGLLETENTAVCEWAESLYDDYRMESEPLDPERLPGT